MSLNTDAEINTIEITVADAEKIAGALGYAIGTLADDGESGEKRHRRVLSVLRAALALVQA